MLFWVGGCLLLWCFGWVVLGWLVYFVGFALLLIELVCLVNDICLGSLFIHG